MAPGPCTTCPDNDGDGYTAARCGGEDCDDNDDSVYPKAPEFCGDDKDNDCDRKVDCEDETCQKFCTDSDGDGFSTVDGDCNDNDKTVFPGAPEKCDDTIDNNCNSEVNEGCGGGGCDPSLFQDCLNVEGARWDESSCRCIGYPSPVIVDTTGDGFRLTGAAEGVRFDFDSDGAAELLSWTAAGSDDSWLALDRDGDGRIRGGRELFGDFTPQPPSPAPNGFLALAEFDKREQGGNGDGLIDSRDSVFASLRLWRDADHDGVSQPGELYTLAALGVGRLHLDYKESKRTDAYGNRFRYRAKVDDAKGAKAGRWAWDVFLVAAP